MTDRTSPGGPRTALERAGTDASWLSLAQAAAGFGLWEHDVLTGQMRWDAVCLRLFGLTEADLDGTVGPLLRVVHPDDLPRVSEVIDRAVRTGGPLEVRYRFVRPDGTSGTALSKGHAEVGPDGATARLVGVVLDVEELTRLDEARAEATRRTAQLVGLARDLNRAQDETEVVDLVLQQSRSRLGGDTAVVTLLERPTRTPPADGLVRSRTTLDDRQDVQQQVRELPTDFPLPMVWTAASGQPLFLGDRAAVVELFPGAEELYVRTGAEASASVPLRVEGTLLGSLSVGYRDPVEWTAEKRAVLDALADLAAQAVGRVRSRDAERKVASTERVMLAALQRSLLTEPPRVPGLSIAARYEASAQWAQIGGDWYDAHPGAAGELVLSVGDVTGHDSRAAAAMASVRNLLRATSLLTPGGPAEALGALDRIMHDLDVGTLATAVLATITADPLGRRRLCWSNAGHPPPLLLRPDGDVEVLRTASSDVLLGCSPTAARRQQSRDLPPGSTLLLYSDGLIERRGEDFDVSLERLTRTLAAHGHLPVDGLSDHLLASLSTDAEDDMVVLVVRAEQPGTDG